MRKCKKYFKYIKRPCHFFSTLVTIMDPRIKLVGVETLINSINEYLKIVLKVTANNVKESLTTTLYSLYKKNIHMSVLLLIAHLAVHEARVFGIYWPI